MEKGKTVRGFFQIEARTLYERFKAVEKLLPNTTKAGASHPAEEGRFVESLLRDFLNKHLPKNLQALSGFILRPSTKTGMENLSRVKKEYDVHSSQIDIIVYDLAQFPVYERFEEFCIVPPEGVIAVISVKKTLRMGDIEREFASLLKISQMCMLEGFRNPYTCLFAFTSSFKKSTRNQNKIFNLISKVYTNRPFDFMINEISIMDSFMFFKFREESSDRDSEAKYVIIDLSNNIHISLQRILQSVLGVYYCKFLNNKIERPGYVSFEKGTFGNASAIGYVKYNDK